MPSKTNLGTGVSAHPTLVLRRGIEAAKGGGALRDVVNALETYWDRDLEPVGLPAALNSCGALQLDGPALNGFYGLLCKIKAIRRIERRYTNDDVNRISQELNEIQNRLSAQEEVASRNELDASARALITAMNDAEIAQEARHVWFDRFERARYHHFWPATSIADVLARVFAETEDPGRTVGNYFRAMFDGPVPNDDRLGIRIDTTDRQNDQVTIEAVRRLAELASKARDIPENDRVALSALLAGDYFGVVVRSDQAADRKQALELAAATAAVTNQRLFTALSLEAVGCTYLATDDPNPAENVVVRSILVALLLGTDNEAHKKVGATLQTADLYQNKDLANLTEPFAAEARETWSLVRNAVHRRAELGRWNSPRFPPQLLFMLINWRNCSIAEMAKYEEWLSDDALQKQLLWAQRYSEVYLQGRAYFGWSEIEEVNPITESWLTASSIPRCSVPTLLAIIESSQFRSSYSGDYVDDRGGYGDLERELVRRSLSAGYRDLGAALLAFFIVAHVFKRGYLPEVERWQPLVAEGLHTRLRDAVLRAIGYAAEHPGGRGCELAQLRIAGLMPDGEQGSTRVVRGGWISLAGGDTESTVQNIREFLGGVDPREIFDSESLRQWVSAHHTDRAVRANFGAQGLLSWVAPGHGYHAAMECTLRERLNRAYQHGDYREFKASVGEADQLKKQPSLDHLLSLLRDANRDASVKKLLDSTTSLHIDSTVVSRLERLNQQYRVKTGHGKQFSHEHMGELLELLFGRESLFRQVALNLLPRAREG